MKNIIIIGCGFSGSTALKILSRRATNCNIIVIDKINHITMLPALPDVASGFISNKYLKGTIKIPKSGNISFINEEVKKIDLDSKKIIISDRELSYDFLLISSGAKADLKDFNFKTDEIYFLDSLKEAVRLQQAIDRYINSAGKELVISGAGYTGLELAASIRKKYPVKTKNPVNISVIEVQNNYLPFLSGKDKEYISGYLKKHEISILTETSISDYTGKTLLLNSGKTITNPLLIWSAGTKFTIDDISGKIKQHVDGRIIVNEHLQLPGYPEVFASGDSAAIRSGGGFLRKSVNFALSSGKAAAKNINLILLNKQLKQYSPFDPGWIIPLADISIGQIAGIFKVKGKTGLRLHYLMCGLRNFSIINFLRFLYRSIFLK